MKLNKEESCEQNAELTQDGQSAFEEINNLNKKTMRVIMINSAIMLAVNLIYLIYQISMQRQ